MSFIERFHCTSNNIPTVVQYILYITVVFTVINTNIHVDIIQCIIRINTYNILLLLNFNYYKHANIVTNVLCRKHMCSKQNYDMLLC